MARHEELHGKAPSVLTADVGYGSQENYTLLEEKEVTAYVKYGLFDTSE